MAINMFNFVINDNEKIIMPLYEVSDIVDYAYLAKAELIIFNQMKIIGSGAIGMQVAQLQRCLKLVIAGQRFLHESITKSIGYYYNQDLYEKNPNIFLI